MRKETYFLFFVLMLSSSCTNGGRAGLTNTSFADNGESPTPITSPDERQSAERPVSEQVPSPSSDPTVEKSPVAVNVEGQNITYSTKGELEMVGDKYNYDIILPSDILFNFDKYDLRPEAADLLQKLKAHFDANKTDQVRIWGYTDSKGDDVYNLKLSQKRAGAVQTWLKAKTGIFAMALGMGERDPLLPNENPDGTDNPQNRQRNRRVTISVVVYPKADNTLNKNSQ